MKAPQRLRERIGDADGVGDLIRAAPRTAPLTHADRARLGPRIATVTASARVAYGSWLGAKGLLSAVLVGSIAVSSITVGVRSRARGGAATPVVASHVRLSAPVVAATELPRIEVAPPLPSGADALRVTEPVAPPVEASRIARHEGLPRGIDPLAAEAAEMEQALALLATDPRAALTRLNHAARVYPRGQLATQREDLAIDALFRLNRQGEAVARSHALLSGFPDSIAAERVRAMLRSHQIETASPIGD